jgi:ABC-type Fe3+-hydroxamate transport system substrate-binding protein
MPKKQKTIEKQKRKIWLLIAVLIISLFVARHFIRDYKINSEFSDAKILENPKIAVIGDNLVEICLSLGLQDSLVAVGYYGNLPLELKNVKNLGVMNISEEQLIKTKPDIVIASDSAELKNKLQTIIKMREIKKLFIRHENFNDVINAINIIANATRKTDESSKIIAAMKAEIDITRTPAKDAPSVLLVSFAQKDESGGYNKFYCAGVGTFLDEVLVSAGAKNALPPSEISWPSLSVEEIIKYNPDIIVDLRPDTEENSDDILKIWEKTAPLKAVQKGNVFVIIDSYVLLPSPKLIKVHKLFKKIILDVQNK